MKIAIATRFGLLASVAALLPGLLGCLEHPLKPVEYDKAQEDNVVVNLAVNKDVDILFVIDNSGSMGEEQATLSENFESFIGVLEAPNVEANYRIGITTTDNGNPSCTGTTPEGGKLRLSSCRSRQSDFVFTGTNPATDKTQEACLDVCPYDDIEVLPTATELDEAEKPHPWFENIEGRTNLGAGSVGGAQTTDQVTTVEAFQCFGPQGINGCGFESHLESMWKSLKLMEQDSSGNYGFLRKNAILSVIHVTDEADCSYNTDHGEIFDRNGGNKVFWSNPDEDNPTSAVCWNAGVKCVGSGGVYTSCDPVNKDVDGNEGVSDADAVLHPISRYVDLLQAYEDDKDQRVPGQEVIVAVIGGVPNMYDGPDSIEYKDAADPAFQEDFGIGPGCTSASGEAVPPVRLRDFAAAFEVGDEHNMFSICNNDYSQALDAIARAIVDQVKPACMTKCVADTDPATPDRLDPLCTVEEIIPGDNGTTTQDVPQCIWTCGGSPCAPGQEGNADGWNFPSPDDNVCFLMLTDDNGSTPSSLDDMAMECSEAGWNLEFKLQRREGFPAVGGTNTQATCQLSQLPEVDCPKL